MSVEEQLQTIFEGLIDYFFDPDFDDETFPAVVLLIKKSKRAQRLGKEILPSNTCDILRSSGWNYHDYAASIKAAEAKLVRIKPKVQFIVNRENLTFAECCDAEDIIKTAREILAILDDS